MAPRLTAAQWRVFRLWLVLLSDRQVAAVQNQLHLERRSRGQTDRNAARLFFSSLGEPDLALAGDILVRERVEREVDRRWEQGSAMADGSVAP